MRRKLIQHGRSSLTVSLPKKWVKEKNLKKGEEIEVEESNGTLVISAEKHHKHKKIDIDVSGAQPMIRRIIGATFKSGYDEVDVRFSSYDELKAVQELVREQFTGFEIINEMHAIAFIVVEEKDMITFRDVLKPHRGEVYQD